MAGLCKELGVHLERQLQTLRIKTASQNGQIGSFAKGFDQSSQLQTKELWAEVSGTVGYLKNSLFLKDETRYEGLYGVKPDLSHLIAVRRKGMPHIPKSKNQTLDSCAEEGTKAVYCGSAAGTPSTTTVYADFINETRKPQQQLRSPKG